MKKHFLMISFLLPYAMVAMQEVSLEEFGYFGEVPHKVQHIIRLWQNRDKMEEHEIEITHHLAVWGPVKSGKKTLIAAITKALNAQSIKKSCPSPCCSVDFSVNGSDPCSLCPKFFPVTVSTKKELKSHKDQPGAYDLFMYTGDRSFASLESINLPTTNYWYTFLSLVQDQQKSDDSILISKLSNEKQKQLTKKIAVLNYAELQRMSLFLLQCTVIDEKEEIDFHDIDRAIKNYKN